MYINLFQKRYLNILQTDLQGKQKKSCTELLVTGADYLLVTIINEDG